MRLSFVRLFYLKKILKKLSIKTKENFDFCTIFDFYRKSFISSKKLNL